MHTIIICSNDETICDGHVDHLAEAWGSEISAAYVMAAAEVIDAARYDEKDVDYETESFFAHWHGGKHTKVDVVLGGVTYGYGIGLVVCHTEDCPQWIKDLCDKAEAAGSKARDEAVAEYEVLATD